MQAPYSRIPLVPIAVGLIAGIILFDAGLHWSGAAAITVIAVALLYFRDRFYTFGLLSVGVGWFCAFCHAPVALLPDAAGKDRDIHGEILRIMPSGDNTRMLVEADTVHGRCYEPPVRLWVMLLSDETDAGIGSKIKARGRVVVSDDFDGLPYETDAGIFSKADGAVASMIVFRQHFTTLSSGNGYRERLRQLQSRMADAIYLSGVEGRTADFLVATVCGEDSYLPKTTVEMFRVLGLAHLLALSGFHVAIFAWMISLAVYPLKLSRRYARLRHIIVMATVWGYVLSTGIAPSTVRAALLLSVVLAGRMMQRRGGSYNALAASAVLMLCVSPYMLFSPGFQLSFAAVLGLMIFAEPLNPFNRRRRFLHAMASAVTVPLAAVLGTWLVSAIYFHTFPLFFLPANIAVGAIASALIACGVVLMILGLNGFGITPLAWGADCLYNVSDSLCRSLMGLPETEIRNIDISWYVVLILVVATVFLAVAVNRRKVAAAVAACGLCLLAFCSQRLMAEEPPAGEFYIPANTDDSRMVMRHGGFAALYTGLPEAANPALVRKCSERYSLWLAKRDCRDGFVMADSIGDVAGLRLRGNLLSVGPYSIWIVDKSGSIPEIKVDYIVLMDSGKVDIDEIVRKMSPRIVVLTSGLRPGQREKYAALCRLAGQPVHNAADSTFRLLW
ncbi:MAG: ComEC/Rec2 family competence protein [Muribaculaceae bacterium]|nr:ComEC/Rec2 family competence protein [Muribaculaceae bacterium]